MIVSINGSKYQIYWKHENVQHNKNTKCLIFKLTEKDKIPLNTGVARVFHSDQYVKRIGRMISFKHMLEVNNFPLNEKQLLFAAYLQNNPKDFL